jgi:raffinose/stachyose/melibiose transport system substrate-binding protein
MFRKNYFLMGIFFFSLILFISCKDSSKTGGEGPVEIVVWGGAELVSIIESIAVDFNEANQDIHVTLSVFSEIRDLIKPAINSGEGPDLFSYDTGAGYLGVMVDAGLALDLTPYAEKYQWQNKFLDWALDVTTYDGRLYGIANQMEMLGVFYNKKIFADNNLVPPETYDEFLSICKILFDAGIQPVVLTDKDQWPGFHYESIWMNIFAGPQKVKDALGSKIPWTDPALILGMDKLAEFARSPYVNKRINSLGYDDANALFHAGEYAMQVTGTWMVGRNVDNMGDNVGFFYMPPGLPSVLKCPPGGFGEAYVINGKTKHPDETAAFLNHFFGEKAVRVWYEGGYIPAVKNIDYSSFVLSILFADVLNEINGAETLGTNIDVIAGQRVNEVTQNYVQQLIDGRIDGAKAMQEKQKAHEEDMATAGI